MVWGKTRKESLWLNRDVLCVRLKRAVQGKVTENSGSSLGSPLPVRTEVVCLGKTGLLPQSQAGSAWPRWRPCVTVGGCVTAVLETGQLVT